MPTPGLRVDQVADAFVSVPSVVLDVMQFVPSSGQAALTSDTFVDIDAGAGGKAEAAVVFPVAGKYSFDTRITALNQNGTGTIVEYRLIIDKGLGSEIIIEADNERTWSFSYNATTLNFPFTFKTPAIEIAAGSHTVTVQWRRGFGADTIWINVNTAVNVMATLSAGSGAGGVLVGSAALASDYTSDSTGVGDLKPVTGLSVVVACVVGEEIELKFAGTLHNTVGGIRHSYYTFAVDGTPLDDPWQQSVGQDITTQYLPVAFTRKFTATATSHTVTMQMSQDVSAGFKLKVNTRLEVWQSRGGLVPIQKDGVDVVATPRAIDFVGGQLQVAAVTGKASVSFQGDTKPLKGTWKTGAVSVDFAARLSQPSTTRQTLQDGVQYTSTGTLTWAIANGVGLLGYDHADSQGNTKWLYFYEVPNGAVLSVVASDNPPSVGPTGYTDFKCVWKAYINGSGNLVKAYQRGNVFKYANPPEVTSTCVGATQAAQSVATEVPPGAAAGTFVYQADKPGDTIAWVNVFWWSDGDEPAEDTYTGWCHKLTFVGTEAEAAEAEFPIEMPTSTKQFHWERQEPAASTITISFRCTGWIDEDIEA